METNNAESLENSTKNTICLFFQFFVIYNTKLGEILANINLNDVSKAEEELKLAYSDLIAFGKLFLPDDFMRSETPFFHYEVADALSNLDFRQFLF